MSIVTVTLVAVTSPDGGVRMTICGTPDTFGLIEATSNAADWFASSGD